MVRAPSRWYVRVAADPWAPWSEPVASCVTGYRDLLLATARFEQILGVPRALLRVAPYAEQPPLPEGAPVVEPEDYGPDA